MQMKDCKEVFVYGGGNDFSSKHFSKSNRYMGNSSFRQCTLINGWQSTSQKEGRKNYFALFHLICCILVKILERKFDSEH